MPQLPDNSLDLIITSPPFALQRKKEYGNESQAEYVAWLSQFAKLVYRKLKSTGSFVLDLEDFYWYNPSKLPSPIEWVNKRKIRAKDSVNTVWWFSKTEWPKADVTKVLVEYSGRMKKLIENPKAYYTPKERPSGHNIGSSFGKDNGGAIPSNLLQIPNSESNSQYLAACKELGVKEHPA